MQTKTQTKKVEYIEKHKRHRKPSEKFNIYIIGIMKIGVRVLSRTMLE